MEAWTTAALERVLELPQGFLSVEENLELPETKALIKMINAMPWLLKVAEAGFSEKAAQRELLKAAIDAGMLDKKG